MKDIGTIPWTADQMRKSFVEFSDIYQKRPILDNAGGMKVAHAFLTWFIFKETQPKFIIESGVFKGQSTWILETACPSSKLICLEPNLGRIVYRSPNAEYFDKDFDLLNTSDLDSHSTMCFFDDHQSAIDRLKSMWWKGIRRAVFEDNYPPNRGDCYSLRKILHCSGHTLRAPTSVRSRLRVWLRDRFGASYEIPANETHRDELLANLETYWEGPPLYRTEKTRWGDDWTDTVYPTKAALFDTGYDDWLVEEAQQYTWLCFVELIKAERSAPA